MQSRRFFAEFYQATTFLILKPLAAAVCTESAVVIVDLEAPTCDITQQPHPSSPQRDPGGGGHLCWACGTPCCISQARGEGMEFRAGPSLT
ncbi:hypothetical protein B0H16DRAFT_88789 [Mycena metata]|uniref:Secreted protein n=1 Tax=Mycena metata TaxID=1033252 RepID=A0AAD7JZT0_9AGAR|nr:hypothetical protein B0H16DRAFT_88789 [Mycena metata]